MAADPQTQPAPVASKAETFTTPSISHLENVAYLVGYPIAHSSSPGLHNTISSTSHFSYAQVLAETKDLKSFIHYLRTHASQPRLLGSGVTMPHKVNVIPLLDDLTPEAKAVGAVNTIFFQPDPSSPSSPPQFVGHNTDTIGIRDAFLHNLPADTISTCKSKPALIVGGGGTCRAAIFALQHFLGASTVYIVNRDAAEVETVLDECRARGAADQLVHVSSLDQAKSLEPPSLIVSAVPDFSPQTDSEKTARTVLSHFLQVQTVEQRGALLEMCYHPSPDTQITALAAEAGWTVIPGLEAMIGQGLEQAKLWTGVVVTEALREAAREAVRPKK